MKYKIICDFCENFDSKTELGHINDHQTKETFEEILFSMRRNNYECDIFGGVPELISAYEKHVQFDDDTIFINLSDGMSNRYSRVQIPVLCDLLNIKYSGGGTFETALTTNKFYSSLAVKNAGFLAPNGYLITKGTDASIPNRKSLVKPNSEGSSVGITNKSICATSDQIRKQVNKLLSQFSEVLVEDYIPGYDVTCFVIGNESIVLNEVLIVEHHNKLFFENDVLGYEEHLLGTRQFLPCSHILPQRTENEIKKTSIAIKNLFNIYDFCRIDYRVTNNYNIYFLEINTVPAISIKSQVGVICKKLGIVFDDFIHLIIQTVSERFNHE